nr:hypothetical protein [uncultured Brevundimonas sp.]
MKRFFAIAAVALLTAACAPQTASTNPNAPVQSADAAACAARNGTMRQVGRLQSWQCVINYADAGKVCSSSSQCQGECRLPDGTEAAMGAQATGVCQATSDRFGCNTRVEDGKAGSTLCID